MNANIAERFERMQRVCNEPNPPVINPERGCNLVILYRLGPGNVPNTLSIREETYFTNRTSEDLQNNNIVTEVVEGVMAAIRNLPV